MQGKIPRVRPPFPPLSESLVSSGLVPQSVSMVRTERTPNLNPPVQDSFPLQKPRRRLSQKFRSPDTFVQFCARPTPVVPQPTVLASYRPPPLTVDTAHHRPLAPQIPIGTALAERQITAGATMRKLLEAAVAGRIQDREAAEWRAKCSADRLEGHK
jgi:hypothetical protein